MQKPRQRYIAGHLFSSQLFQDEIELSFSLLQMIKEPLDKDTRLAKALLEIRLPALTNGCWINDVGYALIKNLRLGGPDMDLYKAPHISGSALFVLREYENNRDRNEDAVDSWEGLKEKSRSPTTQYVDVSLIKNWTILQEERFSTLVLQLEKLEYLFVRENEEPIYVLDPLLESQNTLLLTDVFPFCLASLIVKYLPEQLSWQHVQIHLWCEFI